MTMLSKKVLKSIYFNFVNLLGSRARVRVAG